MITLFTTSKSVYVNPTGCFILNMIYVLAIQEHVNVFIYNIN